MYAAGTCSEHFIIQCIVDIKNDGDKEKLKQKVKQS
jgi:hypothetical protein